MMAPTEEMRADALRVVMKYCTAHGFYMPKIRGLSGEEAACYAAGFAVGVEIMRRASARAVPATVRRAIYALPTPEYVPMGKIFADEA